MVRTLSAERREQFLAAALKLFAANGVQNTTTAQIAKEAGTAAGTLFLYFPTKSDLVNELVLKISQEQSAAIRQRLDPSSSARETFLGIWTGLLCWFRDNMDAFLYIQQVRESSMISPRVVAATEEHLSYYFAAIQKGLAEGSVRPYPLELVGGILYQHIVAVMNLIRAQPDSAKAEEYIQTGFDIFWNGIKSERDVQGGKIDAL